jgi:rhodanese-related sulfurtransferase
MGLLDRLFGAGSGHVPEISTEELLRERSRLILVEALAVSAFAQGHLPGAINIPRAKVQELAPSLLPDKSAAIVTYCKSPT